MPAHTDHRTVKPVVSCLVPFAALAMASLLPYFLLEGTAAIVTVMIAVPLTLVGIGVTTNLREHGVVRTRREGAAKD